MYDFIQTTAHENQSTETSSSDIVGGEEAIASQEWARMSDQFGNSGYREGIVAGKESALQAGFDDGFADIGAPLGRHLGMLRGLATGLRTFLDSPRHSHSAACEGTKLHGEIVRICEMLSLTQLSDIAPVDLEAFEHAKAHPHSASSTDHADICESRKHTNRLSASQSSLLGMLSELGMGDLSNLEYVEPNFMARFTPVKDPIAEI